MNQKIKPIYFFTIALFLVLGFVSMIAIAKNDNSGGDSSDEDKKVESSSKDKNNTQDSQNISDNLKNYKKADTAKGETNAQIHKEKTTQVIERLEQERAKEDSVSVNIATSETEVNVEAKNKAKKQIAQVVTEQEASQETVTEAINEVENDGVAKKFFLGPDYKNLGQLRSELVHNRNQIRQLNQAMVTLSQAGGDTTALAEQLVTLTQERERIKSIILANESSFSLFGWVSRFLANYEETPINEEEENELTEETQETIVNVGGTTTAGTNSNTGTANTTTTNTTVNTDATTANITTTTDGAGTSVESSTGSDTTTVDTNTGDDQIDTTIILTR